MISIFDNNNILGRDTGMSCSEGYGVHALSKALSTDNPVVEFYKKKKKQEKEEKK